MERTEILDPFFFEAANRQFQNRTIIIELPEISIKFFTEHFDQHQTKGAFLFRLRTMVKAISVIPDIQHQTFLFSM